jgi:hypothetical protein
VYVHLNPVRAGLCRDPLDYVWTSHRDYAAAGRLRSWMSRAVAQGALPTFATCVGNDVARHCTDYMSFLEWRRRLDLQTARPDLMLYVPNKPCTASGDDNWSAEYGAASGIDRTVKGYRADLRDLALKTMAQFAPDMDLGLLCSGGRTRPLVSVRRQLISRALVAGYRTSQIARFLNVSSTAISYAARPR